MAIQGYRVFDAHVHIQPWHMLKPDVRARMTHGRADLADVARYQEDPAAFVAHLREQGVERAVLVNYVSPDVMGFTPPVNEWIAAYCRDHPELVAVGSVHPKLVAEPGAEVDRLHALGIRALKVHPSHQLLYPHAYATGEMPSQRAMYARAEALGMPVIVHTGTSVFPGARNRFADPMFLDDVAIDFPRLRLVLAHAGRPLWMETAFFLARRHENVSLDVSGIPPARLLEYLPRAGEIAGKLLWGTDWPSPGVRSLKENVESFLKLPLDEDAKRRILWDNAERVFG